jgi:hypothetical protein
MSKTKLATLVTVAVMVAYAVYLMVLSMTVGLPTETVVVLARRSGIIFDLPFPVSYWWNLLFFPAFIFFVVYYINLSEIVGDVPEKFQEKIYLRHSARQSFHWANLFSMTVSFLSIALGIILWPLLYVFLPNRAGMIIVGPATVAVIAVIFYSVLYVFFSVFLPFIFFVSGEHVEKLTLEQRYETSLVVYVKMGVAKTFFCVVGLTLGFVIMFILSLFKKRK